MVLLRLKDRGVATLTYMCSNTGSCRLSLRLQLTRDQLATFLQQLVTREKYVFSDWLCCPKAFSYLLATKATARRFLMPNSFYNWFQPETSRNHLSTGWKNTFFSCNLWLIGHRLVSKPVWLKPEAPHRLARVTELGVCHVYAVGFLWGIFYGIIWKIRSKWVDAIMATSNVYI